MHITEPIIGPSPPLMTRTRTATPELFAISLIDANAEQTTTTQHPPFLNTDEVGSNARNSEKVEPRSTDTAALDPVPSLEPSIGNTSTDNLDATIARMHARIDRFIEQSRQHYEMLAKTYAQITAATQQLVQLLPHFLATLSKQNYAPYSPQLKNNPYLPETDRTPPESQLLPWTISNKYLPPTLNAHALNSITNPVKNKCLILQKPVTCRPSTNQPLHHRTRYTTCLTNSSPIYCMTYYGTKDQVRPTVKHVRFKTPAPCSPGHTMFWSKEDMRPP